MQANQVKQELPKIQEQISEAERICEYSDSASEELKEVLSELSNRSSAAQQLLEEEEDEQRIVEYVDELEELSDRAMKACRESSDSLDLGLQHAVRTAHKS
ncbi:MAG TPA: hypothetical protein VJU83_10950, partial [Burkholderiales bacterium]|nr:hypothetical protein [Burkholderiales bacterium]